MTPFAPLALPMPWRRIHVGPKVRPPDIVFCDGCENLMCGLPAIRDRESAVAMLRDMPPTVCMGNVPGTTPATENHPWVCFVCNRAVMVTR